MFQIITDVLWKPITNKNNREYLRLTYAASSYMEYPENWKERMEIWEKVLGEIEESMNLGNEANSSINFKVDADILEFERLELSVI